MKFQLHNGREAHIGVKHIKQKDGRRGTRAWVRLGEMGESIVYEGVAMCSPRDNFSKRLGRKMAANRLLGVLREKAFILFDEKDRRAIFQTICPEFCQ